MCSAPKVSQPRYQAPQAPRDALDQARNDAERRRRAASGFGGTILTGAGGVTNGAATSAKTLLGQ